MILKDVAFNEIFLTSKHKIFDLFLTYVIENIDNDMHKPVKEIPFNYSITWLNYCKLILQLRFISMKLWIEVAIIDSYLRKHEPSFFLASVNKQGTRDINWFKI